MEDYNCFCVICGFIIGLEPNEYQPGAQDWWKAVLFRARPTHICDSPRCSKRHNGDGRTIEQIHASFTEGGPSHFYDPTLEPFRKKFHTINDIWQDDRHPWVGVHPKCLEIASRVVDFRNSKAGNILDADVDADDGPTMNLGRLYEIYRSRCDHQTNYSSRMPFGPPFIVVWEPHRFFGFASSLIGARADWEERDPRLSVSVTRIFETCMILSNANSNSRHVHSLLLELQRKFYLI